MELISINEAVAQGIDKLRMPRWSNPTDHIKIDIINGRPGPWIHFYSVVNEEINGRNPVDTLITEFDLDDKEYLPLVEADAHPKQDAGNEGA